MFRACVVVAVAAAAGLATGCEELATGLATYADDLDIQNGAWYDDEHHSQSIEGNCPTYWEYGRVSNRSYQRVRNQGDTSGDYTLTWSSGVETTLTLSPGETSDYFYMTPSIIPEHVDVSC